MARGAAGSVGPSNELRTRFAQLRLSQHAWISAAKRHLKHIAGDLPLFDSAWIDACVCDRLLTPWQADVLNSSDPDSLFVGPMVLESLIETTAFGPLLRGRHSESGAAVELIRVRVPAANRRTAWNSLDQLVSQQQELSGVIWPRRVVESFESDGYATVVYPAADGIRLRDWIVRRGRVPADVVASVASQLLETVHACDRIGRFHGDIRCETVRISANGRVQLSQMGIRAAMAPTIQYREGMPPELCGGIAPERIGTNEPVTAASERYAIGCLLWELLAGRAITPHGSALGCLRAHLEHHLPELEDFAPDTPASLLDLIRGLLSVDPATRPRDITGESPKPKRIPSLSRLPRGSTRRRSSSVRKVSAGKVLTLAASIAIAVGTWLSVPAFLSAWNERAIAEHGQPTQGPTVAEAAVASPQVSEIPALPTQPDASGKLELGPGRWLARDLAWFGTLTIVGDPSGTTEILLDAPWTVHADAIHVERLAISGRQPADVLIDVHTQDLTVSDVRLDASTAATAIRWTALDSGDASGRRLHFDRCRIEGSTYGLALASDALEVSWTDVLAVTEGTLVTMKRWPRSPAVFRLDHSTVRGVNSLISLLEEDAENGQPVKLRLESSLIESQDGGLMDLAPTAADGVVERLTIEAPMSIVHSELPWPIFAAGPEAPIAVGRLEFAGPSSGVDDASRLISADVPLPPDNWPGFRRGPSIASASNEPREDATTRTAGLSGDGRSEDEISDATTHER